MSSLKALELIFNLPQIKLKKADTACLAIVKVLPAVISSLEHEAAERGDALVICLSKVVKNTILYLAYILCVMFYQRCHD